jgi:hypothetical protein
VRGKPVECGLRPSPQPSPRKNGEREQIEFAAPLTYNAVKSAANKRRAR